MTVEVSPNSRYDVFISYSHTDQHWVRSQLLPRLEEAGLNVIIDYRDFELGRPTLVNIEHAVEVSRYTLVVLSPAWVTSEWTNFESLLTATADPATRKRKLIPLMLTPCELPARIAMLTYADFTNPASYDTEMTRLIRSLGTKARIFISYKRHAKPDEMLAKRLLATLEQAGHTIFIDQSLRIGVQWAAEIQHQIESSTFMVVLLSAASAQSEMVAKEVEYAFKHHQRTGKSRLLPVRINYHDPLPYELSHYLNHLQHAVWHTDADTEELLQQLLDVINERSVLPPLVPEPVGIDSFFTTAPQPYADPRFIESLQDPSGIVRLRSSIYVEREGDERLRREINKRYGTTTTIRAPRQTGKSSLLIRGIAQAQTQGCKVVLIDLQAVDDRYLQSLEVFLHYFATVIVMKLHLDVTQIEQAWQRPLGPQDKVTYLMEDYILPQVGTNIVLAIDEADVLLRTSFHDNFFGLLRFWHNSRAMNDLWDNLDILMVISTEPHLLISDFTQSPFNVGLKIVLEDFNTAQVHELNQRYRVPLVGQEVEQLIKLLNGHPYLTSKALYTLLTEEMTWNQLTQIATTPRSPFGDHLRRYLWLLRDQPELKDALKQIIAHGRCSDEMLYYRLLQAGLIKGMDSRSCTCRCALYETYFKDKL